MKKAMTLLMTAVLTITMFAATGCNQVADGNQDLQVYAVDLGYGVQWTADLLELFKQQDWVKEKYPNLTTSLVTNDTRRFAHSKLNAPKNNNFDILFGLDGLDEFAGGNSIVDITESVFNSTVPGENVLFKDKMDASYLVSCEYTATSQSEKQYYYVPWAGGQSGIIYNPDILENVGVSVPNTTQEWIEACALIKTNKSKSGNANGYSLVESMETGYFNDLFPVFWAQYDGIDGYLNFFNGIYVDENGLSTLSNKIFGEIGKTNGRVEALKVFEEILNFKKGYLDPESKQYKFMPIQTRVVSGNYAFHVNGDWFDREMDDTKKEMLRVNEKVATLTMMKTPIISSIIDVLPDSSVENDSELSALITAIDAGDTNLTGEGYSVTQNDYDRVKSARSIINSCGTGHVGVIPSNSTAQGPATDFLRFMATDIAYEAYAKSTFGSTLPFKYDLEIGNTFHQSLSPLHQDRLEYILGDIFDVYTLPRTSIMPLVKYGSLAPFSIGNYYETFSAETNTKTPEYYNNITIQNWTEAKFNLSVTLAGIE